MNLTIYTTAADLVHTTDSGTFRFPRDGAYMRASRPFFKATFAIAGRARYRAPRAAGVDEGIVAAQHTLYIVVCEKPPPTARRRVAWAAALRAGMIGGCGRRAGPTHGVLRIVGTEAVTDEIPQWLIRDRTQRG